MYYKIIDTPLGELTLTCDNKALTSIEFGAVESKEHNRDANHPILLITQEQLERYFAGKLKKFDLPLDPQGTVFQKVVWNALAKIPYGEVVSYGDVAVKIGNPKSVRAVGQANNKNPIPIVIPCHRVVGKDGSLVGYGGGLDVKRFLLHLEGIEDSSIAL